jgi:pimeloyl-ACP methyl ester carboxylesterase
MSGLAAPRSNEIRALSDLAFRELSDFPGAIRETHLGIAARVFWGVGPGARPVQRIHDALTNCAYGAVGTGLSLVGHAADVAIAWRGVGEEVELSSTPPGAAVIGVLTGLVGDRLERDRSGLHQPVSVRLRGRRVGLTRSALRDAFPAASGRLVVFLHGLMGTEFHWSRGARTPTDTYGGRLARDLGFTPVELRYNSGLHISENGRMVASLLEEVVRLWPTAVEEIVLVGHSMGGLVARSACLQGSDRGEQWVRRVGHVISLGTPHLGAPLEQGAHVAAAALHRLPETRMLSGFLRRRSAGIRDLRHGSLVDEDWRGRDPDALEAVACREVPLLRWATYCFVSATLTRDAQHPLGRLLGDTLVLVPSATGEGRARRLRTASEHEHAHHVGGAHHFALLNHPGVYQRLREWLAADRSTDGAAGVGGPQRSAR